MAKKRAAQTTFVANDDVPAVVKSAATRYKNACLEKGKANANQKAKKDNLITLMHEHDIEQVKIEIGDGKWKLLILEEKEDIKEKVVKEEDPEEAEDAQE